jgi:hypothetical protein
MATGKLSPTPAGFPGFSGEKIALLENQRAALGG